MKFLVFTLVGIFSIAAGMEKPTKENLQARVQSTLSSLQASLLHTNNTIQAIHEKKVTKPTLAEAEAARARLVDRIDRTLNNNLHYLLLFCVPSIGRPCALSSLQ